MNKGSKESPSPSPHTPQLHPLKTQKDFRKMIERWSEAYPNADRAVMRNKVIEFLDLERQMAIDWIKAYMKNYGPGQLVIPENPYWTLESAGVKLMNPTFCYVTPMRQENEEWRNATGDIAVLMAFFDISPEELK